MPAPGTIILLGSGERSPHIRTVYQWLFEQLDAPIHVAILETPAGFELNSDYVAGRIGDYIQEHLPNFAPQVTVVPARRRNTAYSPDDPDIIRPMYDANVLFVGPGSPSYAVRQLQNSLAWQVMLARHHLGAATIIASAATLAVGIEALPIYEIYKVGEDLHWKPGLNLFGPYGLSLVFIPHWNNQEGGAVLDTSRCYMGMSRYTQLVDMLPPGRTVVGIDESTALIVDPATQVCRVMGMGGVTIVRQGNEQRHETGEDFPVAELGPFQFPDPETGLPAAVLAQAHAAIAEAQRRAAERSRPAPEVMDLVEQREAARQGQDWTAADALRDQIEAQGWQVMDTPDGPALEPLPKQA
jgi:hypothetical protein